MGQVHVFLLQVKSHGVTVEVLGRNQGGAAAGEGVEDQFTLVGEQGDAAFRQGYGKGGRM